MFKKLAALLAVGMMAFALTGCVSTSTDSAATVRASAKVALDSYKDVYQPAVLVYGKLTPCSATVTTACRDADTWAKLKAIDLAAETSIEGVRSLLTGTDTSDATMTKIEAAITAINSAISQINATGAVTVSSSTGS